MPNQRGFALPEVPIALRIAGFLVVLFVGLVTYAPILGMGFKFEDDYVYLFWAASLSPWQYIIHTFDPYQAINYRPVFRLLFLLEYELFHSEASYYHIVQILLHCGNALLIAPVVRRLVPSWRVATCAALLYVALPVASEAVFWISDQSPLVTLFGLAMVMFWIDYLRTGSRSKYALALGSLGLGLYSKETAIVFPLVLILVDRVLIVSRADLRMLISRYLPVAIVCVPYVGLELLAQAQGAFTIEGGASLGQHVWQNYQTYWRLLSFPWVSLSPDWDIVTGFLTFVLLAIAVIRKNAALFVVPVLIVLAIGPTVLYNLGTYPRYLYLPAVPVVVLWSTGAEYLRRWIKPVHLSALPLLATSTLLIWSGLRIADAASGMSEAARRGRVPFHDIVLAHPSFPDGTRLFFVDPPTTIPFIAGIFRLRYGQAVSVGGTIHDGELWLGGRLRTEPARLRDYPSAYVYFFDETNRPIEVPVDRDANTTASPPLPLNFEAPVRLEGYEITSSRLARGRDLALILYWRATGSIPRDYTVFVHLVDGAGNIIAGADGMPRAGKERTSGWRMNQLTADAHILRIPEDALVGKGYSVQVGLYFFPTLERLPLGDGTNSAPNDTVVIQSFEVVE